MSRCSHIRPLSCRNVGDPAALKLSGRKTEDETSPKQNVLSSPKNVRYVHQQIAIRYKNTITHGIKGNQSGLGSHSVHAEDIKLHLRFIAVGGASTALHSCSWVYPPLSLIHCFRSFIKSWEKVCPKAEQCYASGECALYYVVSHKLVKLTL